MNLRFKALSLCFVCFAMTIEVSTAQKNFKPDRKLLKAVDQSLEQCAQQYRHMMETLPEDRFPVTANPATGEVRTSGSEPWVGGFYPGALLYLYEALNEKDLYEEAIRKMEILEKEKDNKTTHDLGFMMYCSFGNARRIKPQPQYDEIILTSARSLASRYSEKTGCIRSWDSGPGQFMVIIDNMVNLELLFAATRMTGDSTFYHIATSHANTTMKHHFRSDNSSYHLVIYDPETGGIQKKQTVQGAFDESAWARGQAWGLYGYTMTYRETKDTKYLERAVDIAHFLLDHPNLPGDKIPYWDFNAPDIPNAPRDVSAGAAICSALLELSGYASPGDAKKFRKAAEAMLKSLASTEYLAGVGENCSFLIKHGVGNYPRNADIDVPLIYADYYFVESLIRYKALAKGKLFWE